MKNLILLFCLSFNFFVLAQHCNYQVTVNSDNLKETGKIKLFIKNTDNKNFKVPKEINFCNIYLIDLEYFNMKTNQYEKMQRAKKDIDCFTHNNKKVKLKPGKTYVYDIDIKDVFEILQHNNFFETFNDIKFRFKISFPLESNNRCGESNTLLTDWIYKK